MTALATNGTPRIHSDEPRMERVIVTPEMARTWLSTSNSRNRHLSNPHVDRMAAAMTNGEWEQTHEGIAFDTDGELIDGQHRLAAIARSGVTLTMNVWKNFQPQARLAVDTGKSRSTVDIIKMNSAKHVSNSRFTTLRWFLGGPDGPPKIRPQQALEAYENFYGVVDFAVDTVPNRKGMGVAAMRGLVARASFTCDKYLLEDFSKSVCTGVVDAEWKQAAALLRSYMLDPSSNTSEKRRITMYHKCQRALRAYLDGEPITKLFAAKGDFFPLPMDISRKIQEYVT